MEHKVDHGAGVTLPQGQAKAVGSVQSTQGKAPRRSFSSLPVPAKGL